MIPASFGYLRPASLDEALRMVRDEEDAKVLAGGHSLLPLMRLRLARPTTLVDIGRIDALSYIRRDGDELAIGALTRHHDLAMDAMLAEMCPIVAFAAGGIGDPQVRHMGTIGGSIAHADPAADLPTVLLALGAMFVIQGPAGTRRVAARDMFQGLFTTDVAADELLTEIRVPIAPGRGWSYRTLRRRSQDWAVVGVAALLGDGAPPAVTLTNMADRPVRAAGVELALLEGADATTAAQRAPEGTTPPSETFVSADYRREVSKVMVRRALEEAAGRLR